MAHVQPIPIQRKRPLDPNPYSQLRQPRLYLAYAQCLQQEQNSAHNAEGLMYARLLGYLMLESLGDESRDYVCEEIIGCNGSADLMTRLAKLYREHLLRLFRQNKGRTPAPSEHPSRPSFEEKSFFYSSIAESGPTSHAEAKYAALKRDSHRCMVTHASDYGYVDDLTPEAQAALPPGFPMRKTNACHIFPPSTNMDLRPDEEGHPKTHYAGTVWGIINCFGRVHIEDELNGNQIHRLSNILTMTTDMHELFDDLRLWFEEVLTTPDTYNVCSPNTLYLVGVPPVVTFTTTDPSLALPDKRYLKLHAAVCRIAWMSGAAEYLDTYDREQERRKVLARDGSSAEYLTTQLRSVLVAYP